MGYACPIVRDDCACSSCAWVTLCQASCHVEFPCENEQSEAESHCGLCTALARARPVLIRESFVRRPDRNAEMPTWHVALSPEHGFTE